MEAKEVLENLDFYVLHALERLYGYKTARSARKCSHPLCAVRVRRLECLKELGAIDDKYIVAVFPTEFISNPEVYELEGLDITVLAGSKWSLANNGPAVFGREPKLCLKPLSFFYYQLKEWEKKGKLSEERVLGLLESELFSPYTGSCQVLDIQLSDELSIPLIRSAEDAEKAIKLAKCLRESLREPPASIAYLPQVLEGLATALDYYYKHRRGMKYREAERLAAERVHRLVNWVLENCSNISDDKQSKLEKLLEYGYASYFGCLKEYKDYGKDIDRLIDEITNTSS